MLFHTIFIFLPERFIQIGLTVTEYHNKYSSPEVMNNPNCKMTKEYLNKKGQASRKMTTMNMKRTKKKDKEKKPELNYKTYCHRGKSLC